MMNLGGNQNLTLDFGIYAPQPESLGLGNLVFNDKNNDGIFNNNDEGIEDVEVQLFDLGTDGIKGTTDDNLIAATVTNGFGEYQFSTLPEGTYYVQLTGVGIPAGYVSSTGDGVTDMDGMGFYEPATG
ncbi:MAG: SdrD B-like domain-containing protein [Saprospiraceae bacterium]